MRKIFFSKGIPMKNRLFPPSFWRQPNRPLENLSNPLPWNENEKFETRTGRIKITAPPDTNLLFSLFKILEPADQTSIADDKDGNKDNNKTITRIEKPIVGSDSDGDENTSEEYTDLSVIDDDDPYIVIGKNTKSVPNRNEQKGSIVIGLQKNYSDILTDLVINL